MMHDVGGWVMIIAIGVVWLLIVAAMLLSIAACSNICVRVGTADGITDQQETGRWQTENSFWSPAGAAI